MLYRKGPSHRQVLFSPCRHFSSIPSRQKILKERRCK
nr:MAG TPA: hypothetical protein [Caudoviricetes sp.]